MRFVQHILELLSHLKTGGGIRSTQGAIETARPNPPAAGLRLTQGAIEWSTAPPNKVWFTQGAIEIAWPMPGPPPPPPPPEERGGNDRMLILDLSDARETLPEYEPAMLPEY